MENGFQTRNYEAGDPVQETFPRNQKNEKEITINRGNENSWETIWDSTSKKEECLRIPGTIRFPIIGWLQHNKRRKERANRQRKRKEEENQLMLC